MTQRKKDAQIDLEFESIGPEFIEKHPKLKLQRREHLYFDRYSDIDSMIGSLVIARDRLIEQGAENIHVEFDYHRGYYDDIDFDSNISYQIEESDAEYKSRVVAAKRASERAIAARKKQKIDKAAAEKELYAKLKAKYEK